MEAVYELESMLSPELHDKLKKVLDTYDEMDTYCEKEAFIYGVRFGFELSHGLKANPIE